MRFRQINLDFHTSEKIPDIGKSFDKKQFQNCLKLGHINSITLFAKCHHGWVYHPSKVSEIHPGLDFDLLGAQIEAAHEIGVKTPVYFSSGFDEKTVVAKPEWQYEAFGEAKPDYSVPKWHALCVNTDYDKYLCDQIYETISKYDADGVFIDISAPIPCVCQTCRREMISRGMDPEKTEDVWQFANEVYDRHVKNIRAAVDKVKPGLPIFHNDGHIARGRREIVLANSHLEIESLPTGGWGYDEFPIGASYARTLDIPYLGMTGKFHLTWGEFGGFKHPNALKYEVSMFAANGAKFSIGDQLHPSGRMDEATYKLIGKAYSEAEKKEPWLEGAENIADIGVFSIEAAENYKNKLKPKRLNSADFGCVRVLKEGNYLFNYIDANGDFSKYKVIILPDKIELDDFLVRKLKTAASCGTKILATGRSGLKDGEFAFDFGCEFCGENIMNPSFIRPNFQLNSLDSSAYVVYAQGYNARLANGKLLAEIENPYFNRTVEHFCSHQHAPSDGKSVGCGMSEGNDGIYIAWEMFSEYFENGSIASKEILCNAIDRLLDKTLETNLPSQGTVTLTKQKNRLIVHLLYATAVRRGNVDVIEELVPIHDTRVKVKTFDKPKRVYLAPQNSDIEFSFKDGYTEFTVDCFECHQMIIMEK